MKSSTTLAALVACCRKLTRHQQTPDVELLRRLIERRDDAAFEELVQRYAALVWGVCRRIVPSEADCEDAFQAAFLALFRRAAYMDVERPLGPWLHGVAVRTANKAKVRAARHRTCATIPELATTGDVADEVGNQELFRIVDEEIVRLPSLLQAPFILCCLEGRTRDEAAAALGCSVAAIKSRLERGRGLLRRRLERRGFGLPAAFLVLGLTGERARASLRARALQSALGCASPAVAALVPTAGASLTTKLAVAAMSLVLAGALGLGAFRVTDAEPPKDEPAQAKDSAVKPPPSPAPENPRPLLDRFGDPLPPGAVRRFGTLRFRHAGVRDLTFTPNGKQLIAGQGTAPLTVFDAATGRKLRTVGKSSPNNFGEFAVSPDGKRVACCGFDVFLWDLETGRQIHELKCGRCQSISFSPDGKKIAVVPEWRAEVIIVEAATGKHLAEWTVKKGWVNNWNLGQYDLRSLSFSPDGKYLAGVLGDVSDKNSSQICVLDTANGKQVRAIGLKDKGVKSTDAPTIAGLERPHSPAFQPGRGRLAFIGGDGIIYFWDLETDKEVQRFTAAKQGDGKEQKPATLRFSADGRRCAAITLGQKDRPASLLVLNADTGRELRRIDIGSSVGPFAVALTSDGAAVATGTLYVESCVRVWDVESGKERLADAGHRTGAAVSLSSDGRTLISEGWDGRVIHWDLRSGNCEVRPSVKQTHQREEIGRRVFTQGDQWGDWSLLGRGWRLTYTRQVGELEARSLDGSRLLGKVKVPQHQGELALSPDGSRLAYAYYEVGDDQVRPWHGFVWDPLREKEPHLFGGERGSFCRELQFTHDGKRLIIGIAPPNPNRTLNTIWIWDVTAAKIVRKLPTLTHPGGMILTADDRFLITSDRGRVWDLETGTERVQLLRQGEMSFQFLCPDERFLVSVADERLTVWETASWKPIRTYASPSSPHSMVFSRDGRSLFVANSDSTILEWDVAGRFGKKLETPNRDRLNVLWAALAQTPDKAYPAVWEMLDRAAESVSFLIGKIAPVETIEERRVRQLVEKLDAESFAEREEANRQLLALGEPALPVLRKALKDGPSLEAKKRVERVIEDLTSKLLPDQLRLLRALAVLEWSNRPEAVEHLRRLAGGAPAARITRAAKAACQRKR